MFGISKKRETEKVVTKEEEKGASDEILFDFEEDDKLPFDEEDFADEDFADEDFAAEPARKGLRQPLSQRTLLLGLLLLLALGGGGYYYLNGTPVPPPPQPAAPVKTKVVVQPATPAPTAASAPAAVVNPAPASPTPVVAAPAKELQPAQQVAPAPKSVAVDKTPATTAVAAAPAAAKGEAVAPAVLPAMRQPFTLSAGAFLNQKHQREIEKKIRHLGYTPKMQTTYSMVPMIRLLLGVYDDPAAAQARSRELSTLVPDLFSLKQGAKVALYAGSYQDIDQARRFADQLYQHGILADEEMVSLRMPLKKISFGSFASRAAAEKAAQRAAAVGLSAQVVKR